MKYKINCIMVLPAVNDTWVNWVSVYIKDVYVLSAPYDKTVFTVLTNQGKYISKKYPFPMLAVKLDFFASMCCSACFKELTFLHYYSHFFCIGYYSEHSRTDANHIAQKKNLLFGISS